jgi:hypothetical protein
MIEGVDENAMKIFLTWAMLILGLLLILWMLWSLFRSFQLAKKEPVQFLLPNDLFVSLVVLINIWVILLMLVGSRNLPKDEQQIIVVIISLFAPFFSWWRRTKIGARL